MLYHLLWPPWCFGRNPVIWTFPPTGEVSFLSGCLEDNLCSFYEFDCDAGFCGFFWFLLFWVHSASRILTCGFCQVWDMFSRDSWGLFPSLPQLWFRESCVPTGPWGTIHVLNSALCHSDWLISVIPSSTSLTPPAGTPPAAEPCRRAGVPVAFRPQHFRSVPSSIFFFLVEIFYIFIISNMSLIACRNTFMRAPGWFSR